MLLLRQKLQIYLQIQRRGTRQRRTQFLSASSSNVVFDGLKPAQKYFVYVSPLDSNKKPGPEAVLLITTG